MSYPLTFHNILFLNHWNWISAVFVMQSNQAHFCRLVYLSTRHPVFWLLQYFVCDSLEHWNCKRCNCFSACIFCMWYIQQSLMCEIYLYVKFIGSLCSVMHNTILLYTTCNFYNEHKRLFFMNTYRRIRVIMFILKYFSSRKPSALVVLEY